MGDIHIFHSKYSIMLSYDCTSFVHGMPLPIAQRAFSLFGQDPQLRARLRRGVQEGAHLVGQIWGFNHQTLFFKYVSVVPRQKDGQSMPLWLVGLVGHDTVEACEILQHQKVGWLKPNKRDTTPINW